MCARLHTSWGSNPRLSGQNAAPQRYSALLGSIPNALTGDNRIRPARTIPAVDLYMTTTGEELSTVHIRTAEAGELIAHDVRAVERRKTQRVVQQPCGRGFDPGQRTCASTPSSSAPAAPPAR